MFQRVMFGSVTHDENRRLRDLTAREIAVLVPVLVVIVWIGVYPRPFLAVTEASVKQLLAQVHVGYRVDGTRAESREWRAEPLAPRSGQWTIDDGRSSASVASHKGTESREPRAGMPGEGQEHPQGTRGAGEALIADRTGARHAE
jgi:hypothetical protein